MFPFSRYFLFPYFRPEHSVINIQNPVYSVKGELLILKSKFYLRSVFCENTFETLKMSAGASVVILRASISASHFTCYEPRISFDVIRYATRIVRNTWGKGKNSDLFSTLYNLLTFYENLLNWKTFRRIMIFTVANFQNTSWI